MQDPYSIYFKHYEPSDPRLGRHVQHDSRSLLFQVEAEDLADLKSIAHPRRIPVLDQGRLGSCTGNAAVGCLGRGQFYDEPVVRGAISGTDAVADERVAVQVYADATRLDTYAGQYPPTDTGSDGLSVAKVLQQRKLIAGYLHATSLEATLTALSKQPVIVGTVWRGDMFTPAADGRLVCTGQVEGGHEYVLDELDMEDKRVWMGNSWTAHWGLGGRAYIPFDDLGALLADDGDCTVFVPVSVPAPTPTPTPTPPAPAPSDQKIAIAIAGFNSIAKAAAASAIALGG